MSSLLKGTSLRTAGLYEETSIYGLHAPQLRNRYFILSGDGTRRLLASPEVVGYPCYLAALSPTVAALRYLLSTGLSGDFDILTILRGGLNYPLEEACHRTGIRVRDMHFLSCERIIENHVIQGLDIKYEKVRPTPDRILAIGDILATGDTLRLCLEHFVGEFHRRGGSIRRIVFFTIGGTRALSLMEELTPKIQARFPAFEGFDCFFYEGIFTVYESPGASGIQVRDIDFGWQGGIVAPEFRRFVMTQPDALLEKCIIYDGGARRYEIPLHFEEALDYWNGIRARAGQIDPRRWVAEKLGYDGPLSYEEWLETNHFQELEGLADLWEAEQALLKNAGTLDIAAVADRRLRSLREAQKKYD